VPACALMRRLTPGRSPIRGHGEVLLNISAIHTEQNAKRREGRRGKGSDDVREARDKDECAYARECVCVRVCACVCVCMRKRER
jgi:hypothetical protein